jgi:hypothetical protein
MLTQNRKSEYIEDLVKEFVLQTVHLKEKGECEQEMIIRNFSTRASELVDLMMNYNKEMQKNVNVHGFYMDKKTVFGRNPELPSNPLSIYFFGEVKKDLIVFMFDKANLTADYLLNFYVYHVRKQLRW